jgi:hypothetical protein
VLKVTSKVYPISHTEVMLMVFGILHQLVMFVILIAQGQPAYVTLVGENVKSFAEISLASKVAGALNVSP